jgi:energy-converting hydrogenase A subunit R
MLSNKYLYVTDCEGPVTKNDNAYEIANFFLEEGGKLFSVLSLFDDYLGLFEKKESYTYGSTLKYIIPFFLEAGLKDKDLREYSRKTLILTPGIKDALNAIKNHMDVYVISTSYEHYIEEVISYLQIKRENVYCTKMRLDSYELTKEERSLIGEYKKKLLMLPRITWDKKGNLIEGADETVRVLKELFFSLFPSFPIGKFLDSIVPIGGKEKARILREIVNNNGASYRNVIYVGDSITDVEAFEFLKKEGGLTLSFNGNRYAVRAAEYVVISDNALILSEIVEKYKAHGKKGIDSMRKKGEAFITKQKDEEIVEMSEKMRRTLRGEEIGALG